MTSHLQRRGLALGACLLGLTVAAAAPGQVRWRSAEPTDLADMDGAEVARRVVELAGPGEGRHIIVRLPGPATAGERALLDAAGLRLLGYLGDGAYFAFADAAQLDAGRIGAGGAVLSVAPIARQFKLHPAFAAGDVPAHAIVGRARRALPGADGTIVAVYLILHRDVALADGARIAEAHGALVRDLLETVNGLVVELPLAQVDALADRTEVQWIEPALPRMSETNAQNRALTQADLAQEAPYDLDGTGVTVLVYDGGDALAGHADFGGRLTVIDSAGLSDHATHVSGTVGGDGSITFANRGMAPGVTMLSAGFEWDGSDIFLYTNPGDIEADYGLALSMGADLANNSIGSNTETNGFPCAIQGDYGVTDSVIDAIVRGGLGEPLIVVWAKDL